MSECGTNECSTQSGSCSTPSGSGSPAECRCPGCGQASCPDPYECGMKMWAGSFFQAMQQVQIEILKPKIQKAFGPMMEKAANGTLDAMGAHWQSIVTKAKAREDFKELLRNLWTAGKP